MASMVIVRLGLSDGVGARFLLSEDLECGESFEYVRTHSTARAKRDMLDLKDFGLGAFSCCTGFSVDVVCSFSEGLEECPELNPENISTDASLFSSSSTFLDHSLIMSLDVRLP
jgi:hypothetical protein